jgi:branched-chain amino acid transport system substrate-binding protein
MSPTRLACHAVGLLLAGLLAACAPPSPLPLGFIAGLSGRGADLGEAGRDGALLAVEQANATGGVDGHKIELLIRNDEQNADVAVQAFTALTAEGAAAVLGPMTSSMVQAVLPASEKSGVLLISPTATTNSLTGHDDTLFKVASTTRVHTLRSAEHAYASGHRRIVAVYDLANAAYTRDWLDDFTQAFSGHGGVIASSASFTSGQEASYAQALDKLKAADADALLIIANAVDTVTLLQLARSHGITQPAIGVTWAATEQLIELGGRTVEGLTLTQFFNRDSQLPAYLKFRTDFLARFKREPGFASVVAYDATQAIVKALRLKGNRSLKQALLEAGPYDGVQGQWNFDRFGDAQRKAFVTVVRNGRFVVVD